MKSRSTLKPYRAPEYDKLAVSSESPPPPPPPPPLPERLPQPLLPCHHFSQTPWALITEVTHLSPAVNRKWIIQESALVDCNSWWSLRDEQRFIPRIRIIILSWNHTNEKRSPESLRTRSEPDRVSLTSAGGKVSFEMAACGGTRNFCHTHTHTHTHTHSAVDL